MFLVVFLLLPLRFDLLSAKNMRGHDHHCVGIQTLADCKCGKQPCNYCLSCPCYGCISRHAYLSAQQFPNSNPITVEAVEDGAELGTMSDITLSEGGDFLSTEILDEEEKIDIEMEQCRNTEEQCQFLATLHRLVNEHRKTLDLQLVEPNILLNDVAQRHSCFMALTRDLQHSGTDNREFPDSDDRLEDHITRAGYQYRKVGENVAAGQQSAEEVMAGFLASEKHRDIIETSSFRALGLGLSQGPKRKYWTQIFAEPRIPGVGGEGPTEQHESSVNVAGRFHSCEAFVENGKVSKVELTI
jgi:uncharacterized protein YkwD